MGKQICISSVTRGAAEKAPSEQAAERRQLMSTLRNPREKSNKGKTNHE